ncbi:class 1b ribonucleoside-diphosphate reductase subunit alpha [Deinococcus soli (ex Cha et al. 2016)]|uniref:Ribonucleoside-diphosphate reductase alpha chain n=2 Tax=Deinococcus soli (ex Cha et al. 2016) TaxID=1309411 RepID=A0ACC6KFK8_9DEIO|nr:class 1b ribonucleoside-diphosphate reductase subunit alpha [Deinococcus soli (ex Cha et al. 2016)]MDR6218246.1 ribonucleoside-diphosphate reductase alpha chain [Deinococcus soli (ex Cha et al. 2016)]MDR6328986.1 ribonucleoside-diphosphate reductase alpha chain [Deinococcus soli (ex Cha et al. 2016)]MDR6751259.1 ribonucleoside-diphosphate reductase alpha chain [Deinococcus soli (ex Cha et al. 2016)]
MDRWIELNNNVLAGTVIDTRYDQEALQAYFQEHVNPNTVFFHDLTEKIRYLIDHHVWDASVFTRYTHDEIKAVFDRAYSYRFRFQSFMGAYKFYSEYATMTPDRTRWLERYEDRMAITALARADTAEQALELVHHLVNQTFTPATPTLMNSGKANTGRLVSCFLLADCTDNLTSITKTLSFVAELSKGGGGIGIDISGVRAKGESLRGIQNVSKGVLGVAKMFDHLLRYADQAGQRPGAGAIYLSVMHPDFQDVLNAKKIATDEDARLKTLSVGATIPDVFMAKARAGEDIYQFYPHSLFQETGREFTSIDWTREYQTLADNPRLRKKKVSARRILEDLAITQGESGYPYLLFEGNANRANPIPNVGSIKMSNLCSEILQPTLPSTFHAYGQEAKDQIGLDVSCNLASLVIAQSLASGDLGRVVRAAVTLLDNVARSTSIDEVPAVKRANDRMRSVGLGAMGLHSFLAQHGLVYGSPEALEFVDVYFAAVHYHARRTSMQVARDTGFVFDGFHGSRYHTGEHFAPYLDRDILPHSPAVTALFAGHTLPTRADWQQLIQDIQTHGLAHSFVMAIAPTGSISYVSNASASIMPITEKVETRTSNKARTIYPMPGLNADTEWFYEEAYDMDQRRVIDTVAAAQRHVDQGISCTLFVPSSATTRTLQEYYVYAYAKGVKTLYYTRLRKSSIQDCLSCAV